MTASETTEDAAHGRILAAALRHAAMGLLVVDEQLTVVQWNLWMADTSGISESDALGRTLPALFPGAQLARVQRKVRQVVLLGNQAFFDARVHGAVFPLRRPSPLHGGDGWIQQSCTLTPINIDARPLVCITVTDETAAVLAERRAREAHEALAASAERDGLTGLLNRAAICRRLELELGRAARYGQPLSIVLFDIDHFKAVNDTHGHLGGDAALRSVGDATGSVARESDHAGRYGGEEFLLVLPHTDAPGATVAAERLQARIRDLAVPHEGNLIRLTSSFGIAQGHPEESVNDVLLRADRALYAAKHRGRDCIVVDGDAP